MATTTLIRRRTLAAALPQRTAITVAIPATAAYVYVFDASADNGTNWTVYGCDRITASNARRAADQVAAVFNIDGAIPPRVLRVRVWTWPGTLVPTGDQLEAMTAATPDAVRETGKAKQRR